MAHSRPPFTLVELIITVGVITLLLSFLPRVLSSISSEMDNVECLQTLKSLGRGFSLYTEDHHDFLPHHDAGNNRPPFNQCWYELLGPYLGSKPTHRLLQEPGMTRLHDLHDGKRGHSYKMNSRLQDYKGSKPYSSPPFRHLNSLRWPDETILIFDGDVEHPTKKHQPYGMYRSVENRHQGKASLLMGDLSVQSSSGGHEEQFWSTTGGFIWDGDLKASEQ
jgi:hypothetical protein